MVRYNFNSIELSLNKYLCFIFNNNHANFKNSASYQSDKCRQIYVYRVKCHLIERMLV